MLLPKYAVAGAVAAAAASLYYAKWGVPTLLHDPTALQADLQALSGRQTAEPVIRFIGRAFFFLATAAWVVLSTQSVVVGIQRALYKPKVKPPLQPVSEEAQQQQQASARSGTSTTITSSHGAAAGAAAAPASAKKQSKAASRSSADDQQQQQKQRSQQEERDWRDERRRKALEAAQRAQDEQAAVLRAQQEQQEAERQARRAKAAEEAACQQAAKESAQAAARAEAEARAAAAAAEEARRRDVWLAAVQNQWHRVNTQQQQEDAAAQPANWDPDDLYADDSAAGAGAHAGSSAPAAAHHASTGAPSTSASSTPSAAAAASADRRIVQEQDWEYQQSLERDRVKAAERAAKRAAERKAQALQQQLAALRQATQHKLPPEPPSSSSDGVLALRVRLPGGSQANRRFRTDQQFEDVFAWVYSLPEMPLWAPGTWTLISAFPRRQLAPPGSSTWAPGVWQSQHEAGAVCEDDVLLPGEWMLQVNRLTEAALWVKVHPDMTLQEVQAELQAQTGVAPELQRLIFSGQVLSHTTMKQHRTMRQLGIDQGHVVQLAVRHSGAGSSNSGSDGGSSPSAAGAAAAGGSSSGGGDAAGSSERAQELSKAAGHAYLASGHLLEVTTIAQLQEQVAAGAPLLALYVEALKAN